MRCIFFESAGSDPAEFRDLMQAEGDKFRRLLATRQVDYAELKNALIPTSDGRQVVFLYDWLIRTGRVVGLPGGGLFREVEFRADHPQELVG